MAILLRMGVGRRAWVLGAVGGLCTLAASACEHKGNGPLLLPAQVAMGACMDPAAQARDVAGASLRGLLRDMGKATGASSILDVVGGLAPAVVERELGHALPRLRDCYVQRLQVKPRLGGTLVARFRIGVSGRVEVVSAEGVDSEVSACVARMVKQMEFPRPAGAEPATVRYALALGPAAGELAQAAPARANEQLRADEHLRAHLEPVRACYQEHLAREPALRATMLLELEVRADGAVIAARASGSEAVPELAACVTRAVRGLEFPPTPSGMAESYRCPLVFGQDGE